MGLLDDKVCMITGASRGIGLETVRRFAQEGAVVYGNARTEGILDDEYRDLSERYHTPVIPLYFDVTDSEAARRAFVRIKKERHRLDALVNNAGIMRDSMIGMIDYGIMKDVFDVNVFAVIDMIQYAAKIMGIQGGGSIINLCSIVGVEGAAGQMVYSASKGAVAALTKSASKELAGRGIRVNAVAPGLVDTDMLNAIGEMKIEENLSHVRMGRLGEPADVAGVIAFLASDMAGYVTGEIIGIDGEMQV